MEKANLTNIVDEMQKKVTRARNLSTIYDYIYNQMKFDCCWTSDSDEDGNTIYVDPEEGKYGYELFLAYQEVLKAVEKMITK